MSKPFEIFNESVSWERQAKLIGTPIEIWGNDLIREKNLSKEIKFEDYHKQYFDNVAIGYADMKPLTGALELLDKLEQLKIPIALATTTPRIKFDPKMVYHKNILDKMNCIVTGDEVINGKPSPDIFLLAAKRLGKDPKKCIVFEDSPAGIKGANTAGCYTVAIPDSRMVNYTKSLFDIATV